MNIGLEPSERSVTMSTRNRYSFQLWMGHSLKFLTDTINAIVVERRELTGGSLQHPCRDKSTKTGPIARQQQHTIFYVRRIDEDTGATTKKKSSRGKPQYLVIVCTMS